MTDETKTAPATDAAPRPAEGPGAGRDSGPRGRRGPRPDRPKRRDVNGWVVLDKAVGTTSTQAVAMVKRALNAKKAGHAGTLDPLASGLLPIALGEATKTVPFVMDGRKAYLFTVTWGVETDTDDAEGKAVGTSDLRPAPDAIEAILPDFVGEVMQVPPRFSAIKIAGERAYDLARDGEIVELVARPVEIDRLTLVAPSRRHVRVRGRVRARHLRARSGARLRPAARLPRPRLVPAPHPRRSLHRGGHGGGRGSRGLPRRGRGRRGPRARRPRPAGADRARRDRAGPRLARRRRAADAGPVGDPARPRRADRGQRPTPPAPGCWSPPARSSAASSCRTGCST